MAASISFAGTDYRRLGAKTFWIFLLQRSLAAVLLCALWLFLLSFGEAAAPENLAPFVGLITELTFFIFLLVALFTVLVVWLFYATYKFAFGDEAFKIERGIFNKEAISIPYRQIQDINVRRNIVNRLLGASEIIILTAGRPDAGEGGESGGLLPVVDATLAEELQTELLHRAAASVGRA